MTATDPSFLGNGWNFRLSADSPKSLGIGLDQGVIAEASGDEKIRQSIWTILSTSVGERVGRPDFGCGIHDLVFATRTSGTMGQVIRSVSEALQRWEPRIDILTVDARPHPGNPNGILVEIQYEVRATNSRFNLVYPFYLAT